MRFCLLAAAAVIVALLPAPQSLRAEEIRVAVAANFASTLQILKEQFEAQTDHQIAAISGSTGLLYAQIRSGAPFDVLLAADQERPRLLAANGFGDPDSVFSYALGRLVLWSAEPGLVTPDTLSQLDQFGFRWLAIAEPDIAPYGVAARQTLETLGLWQTLQDRIVRGQNIAQAFAMTGTGNAELGLIALAQARSWAGDSSFVIVPAENHAPILQDGIVLNRAATSKAVATLVAYLQSSQAQQVIAQKGYGVLD